MKRLAGLFCLALLAPACGQAETPAAPVAAPETPAAGFVRSADFDVFAYLSPAAAPQVGQIALTQIHFGGAEEFAKWEGGDRAMPAYAPFMLEFTDLASPVEVNALGGSYHTITWRVRPTSYAIAGDTVSFAGTEATLGAVAFSGTFLPGMRARIAAEDAIDETVMTGEVTFLGARFTDVAFTYWAGD